VALYPVDVIKLVTIPHGAIAPTPSMAQDPSGPPPDLLTWGLLGPGKGIEHVIDALEVLLGEGIRPRYTVSGVTHPNVLVREGDVYRDGLIARVRKAGLADSVTFDDTYRSVAELPRFVATASAVVLPYDSRDQVTSGVLVDAITAARPVIATAFPHAIEMLSTGAGIVVPHDDLAALADAVRVVVTRPAERAAMEAEARRIAPSLLWSGVAQRYLDLCAQLAPMMSVAR
jgi:glycosyltransferase involved in cell wall biosynthesis